MADQKQQKKFKMQIDPKDEGGHYSNMATVIHSETEFLIDFGMFLPGKDLIRVASRIVLSPRTAKQLLLALNQNVQNFESRFGEIEIPQRTSPKYPGGTPELAQ